MAFKRLFLAGVLLALSHVCFSQTKPNVKNESSTHTAVAQPWRAVLRQATPEAYFTNLENGAQIETPFRVTFGLTAGWGIAPITKPAGGKSGHHHLLINRDLPLDFQKSLPFNDQYLHFGKGQMETVLTLEPGTYTLRLLLADHQHIPHFVYSKPVSVTVTRKNQSVDSNSLVKKGISLLVAGGDGRLTAPFRVAFHASGFNIAHLSQNEKDSGHFRLTISPENAGKPNVMDFVNGQTEVWISPPPGAYTLKLDLINNVDPDRALAPSSTLAVRVQ